MGKMILISRVPLFTIPSVHKRKLLRTQDKMEALMREDREKWNKRYRQERQPGDASPLVVEFAGLARPGIALDIAAGQGKNALFLARQGFRVEAVDISETALAHLVGKAPNLHPVCLDLDRFDVPRERYDLIVNMRFLSRRLLPQILDGLKPGGVLIFEAFLAGGDSQGATPHPEYRLRQNELLTAFESLRIVHYRETVAGQEKTRPLASLVGIRE
jgi:SAM-dependent methyltransferase